MRLFLFFSVLFFNALFVQAQTVTTDESIGNFTKDSAQIRDMHTQIMQMDDSAKAFALLKVAKSLCEKERNKRMLIEDKLVEGILYRSFCNDDRKALALYEEAEQLCYQFHAYEKLIRTIRNQALCLKSLGDKKKAITLYYRALKMAEANNDEESQAAIYQFIAHDSYYELEKTQNNFDLAVDFSHRAIDIFTKLKTWSDLCAALHSIGVIYENHEDYDSAFFYFRKSIAIIEAKKETFKELQEKVVTTNVYISMGAAFLGSETHFDSVEYYQRKVMPILQQTGEKSSLGKCYLNMAWASISLHQIAKAKVYLDSSKMLNQSIGDGEMDMNCWEVQYEVDSAMGNSAGALVAFKKYTEMKDSIYSIESVSAVKELNLKFETEKKDLEIESQKKTVKQQKWLIGLSSLLGVMALLAGFFVYRSKQLNQKLFVQKEKGLVLEKDNAVIGQKFEEVARKKAEVELQLEHDEKEKVLLREQLKIEENLRLQDDIAFKHKELATVALNIQQKNKLLEELRDSLSTLSEKVDEDKQDAIKNMRRSIKSNINFDDDWEKVKVHFENVHTGFFDKLIALSPALTPNELKQCAYIKINMNPKEVGNLLGIDAQSVRMSRYRIKKKLALEEDVDLGDFILKM
jgi:tetratricopeptide (TPR) repeat protein